MGLKFRFQGGAPYLPYDETASRLNYLSLGKGIFDYTKLNEVRFGSFHSSDIRIDKKWNFKKTSIDLFLDVTNWYGATNPAIAQYTFKRTTDNLNFATTNGQPISADGSNAIPTLLREERAQITPTIGFIFEF